MANLPRILIRRVIGESMLPTLVPNKIIIGIWPLRVREGDVVIVRHDGLEKTKRVKYLRGKDIFVVGDNPKASTDSRHFGWLDRSAIIAKVIK